MKLLSLNPQDSIIFMLINLAIIFWEESSWYQWMILWQLILNKLNQFKSIMYMILFYICVGGILKKYPVWDSIYLFFSLPLCFLSIIFILSLFFFFCLYSPFLLVSSEIFSPNIILSEDSNISETIEHILSLENRPHYSYWAPMVFWNWIIMAHESALLHFMN